LEQGIKGNRPVLYYVLLTIFLVILHEHNTMKTVAFIFTLLISIIANAQLKQQWRTLVCADDFLNYFVGEKEPPGSWKSADLIPKVWNAGTNVIGSKTYLSVLPNVTYTKYDNSPNRFYATTPLIESSNLPLIIIDTENQANINDEPKINAHLKVIDNNKRNYTTSVPNIYNGNIAIEVRGHYSSTLPQKPYGFETQDSMEQNRNVEFWNLPSENDWILLANYNDKTFLCNSLTYHLFEKMGHYSPRTKHCEVIVNGSYEGIYLFTEKIKIDKNRVDIANLGLEDNSGDELTGGYIFKVDYSEGDDGFSSSFNPIDAPDKKAYYIFHDPSHDDLSTLQKKYLESFVESFESALYSDSFYTQGKGYKQYIDVPSFIDYFILGELSRNSDAFKKSKYYYKDKDSKGGLIHSGPVWDFDWAFKDLEYYGLTDGIGWMFQINEYNRTPTSDGWMVRLMQDSAFVYQVNKRYYSLRETILSEEYLFNYVDSVHSLLNEAQQRHYQKWDILGKNTGAPEIGEQPTTYEGELDQFKDWVDLRLNWLDNNIKTLYEFAIAGQTSVENQISYFRVFPNPAINSLFIENSVGIKQAEIINSTGKKVSTQTYYGDFSIQLNIEQLESGIYILLIQTSDKNINSTKFVKLNNRYTMNY